MAYFNSQEEPITHLLVRQLRWLLLLSLAICSAAGTAASQTRIDWGTQIKNFPAACPATQFVSQISATPTCAAPSAGAVSWSNITAPAANLSLAHAALTTTFTWGAATGASVNLFSLTDTLNNTGTGALFQVNTAAGSAALPIRVCAVGTTTCISMSAAGLFQASGGANINATQIGGVAVTGVPVNGQIPIASSGTAAAWGDPVVSQPTASLLNAQVVGNVASGAADAGNPVKTGAVFNTTQPTVLTGQRVDSQATARGAHIVATGVDAFNVTASGTVTSNQGGAPWTQRLQDGAGATLATVTAGNALKVDGSAVTQPISAASLPLPAGAATEATLTKLPIAQGAALGTNSGPLAQGSVTTAAPTYTTGNINPLSLNLAGGLRVDGSGVTQPVSGTITANIGTSGALALDASVAGLSLAQGAATTGQKALLAEGAVTTAAPTYTTGNSNPLSLTTAGGLRVDGSGVTQPVSAASLPLPTGASTEASLAKLPIAQAAALGTNSGPLVQGSVTTAAPTYTTGTINPLSLTTAGALRTDSSAVTQPVSGTVTANQGTANATPWNENVAQWGGAATTLGQKAMASSVPVALASDQSDVQVKGTTTTAAAQAASVFYNQAVTTAQTVKATAGNLYGWYVYNPNASACFLQIHNTTAPTLGTTVPILSLGIPATGGANIPPTNVAVGNFATAIAVAATTAAQGATTCTTGMTVNVWYK